MEGASPSREDIEHKSWLFTFTQIPELWRATAISIYYFTTTTLAYQHQHPNQTRDQKITHKH